MEASTKPHVAILSSPGLGHLVPVVELAKRLVSRGLSITIFAVATHSSPAESELLAKAAELFDVVELPPDISSLVDPTAAVVTKLIVMMRECRPSLVSAVRRHRRGLPPPVALIVDLFGTESLSAVDELGIPRRYVFAAQSAWFVALTLHCAALDGEVAGQYVDREEPLGIPGCRAVRPRDVVDPMLDRSDQQYAEYLRLGSRLRLFDGVLVNTWEGLQGETVAALRGGELLGPHVAVYPVGPLTRPVSGCLKAERRDEVFEWLDDQPAESVIYVSFGSGGTLSYEQTTELAHGLELSQQRFIWVTRPPIKAASDGAYFNCGKARDDPSVYLPTGFLDRTRTVGRVVPMWAPQADILSHPSVGGFLSHGGWNSTLESLTNGVPMVTWPLYAEQRMNAALLAEELGVAVRPRVPSPSEEVVRRDEIETMVRKIMDGDDHEGREIRARAKKVKASAELALTEGGGSSYVAMSRFVEDFLQKSGSVM